MLPTMNQLNGWKNAQVVRVESIQLYFGLHDDCVVCDMSENRGGLAVIVLGGSHPE
ncbi:MAG TPA: hypothetical protein VFE62_03595 [Gemmataceae bacterium]|nr:hypothetical protein [Gemmataceae bacterium]